MSDDDATQVDMPALQPSSYEIAGPTLQDHPSPFRKEVPSAKRTTPGMPSAVRFEAEVTVKSPPPRQEPILTPPNIEAPELLDGGATMPDGVPALRPDSKMVFDDGLTVRQEGVPVLPRQQGRVPAPDEPLVQVSKSMAMNIAVFEDEPEPPKSPRRRAAEMPTEVLPALKREKKPKKEGSDGPLLILLAVIIVVILCLAGLVGWGLMTM